ncbi:MAG: hypothetical protein HPY53_06255 [Brevinematales bacterium]|nr:hypothetical protein [Brevinematales bacterium]
MNAFNDYYSQPMLPEELTHIKNLVRLARQVIVISLAIVLPLSALGVYGIFIREFRLTGLAGFPAGFLFLFIAMMIVKSIKYRIDLVNGMKIVFQWPVDKKYTEYRKGTISFHVKMKGYRLEVVKALYDTIEEQDLLEVHFARCSKTLLSLYDLSRNCVQKFYH